MLNKVKVKILSLFSGIGAFEFVFNMLNEFFEIEVIGYSEIDKFAIKTYEKNFPGTPNLGDIKNIDISTIKDCDIIVGGSPCQDFSVNGKRKGLEGNKGLLFFEFTRVLKAKKPKFFIFENVKGLVNQNKGKDFEIVKKEFDDAGYNIKYKVLNAKNFGLAQNRERVIIIGQRKDLGELNLEIPENNGDNNPTILKDIVEEKVDSKYQKDLKTIKRLYNGKFASERCEHEDKECHCLMSSGTKKWIVLNKDIDFTKRFNTRKLDINELDDIKARQLTPEEYEKIQGFPVGFTSGISDFQRYKQIGNSIAINLLYKVIKSLFIYMKNNKKLQIELSNREFKETTLERYKKFSKKIIKEKAKTTIYVNNKQDLFVLRDGVFDDYINEKYEELLRNTGQ